MPGIPKMSGAAAAPVPYLLLRRWLRRLLGPAALSWFRTAGLGLCGHSDAVGRARAGAALGAGRGGRAEGGGVGVGRRGGPCPQAAGRTTTRAPGWHSSRAPCVSLPDALLPPRKEGTRPF